MFDKIFSAIGLVYTITYLLFFLVVVGFAFSFLKALFKRKSIKLFLHECVDGLADFPFPFILVIAGLICAPLDLYWQTINYIPEADYKVAAKLSIMGDPKEYYVDTIISYSKDIEYEDYDGDYGTIKEPGTSVSVNETFYLEECSFSDYEFEDLPEYVNSNQQYDVYVIIPISETDDSEEYDEEYDVVPATITFPVFTKENLGITDVYSVYPTSSKKDHYAVFALSAIGLVILCQQYKKSKNRTKQ